MNQNAKLFFIGGMIIALGLAGLLYWGSSNEPAELKGASGIAGTQQFATSTTVGPEENIQLFASKGGSCGARVVSTKESAISITFADPSNGDIASTTLTSMVGFYQAASTTIAYDAELYGCGRWFGHSSASSTITVAEF